jgi:hypothetical protein
MEGQSFEEYCLKKKINADLFKQHDLERFQEWKMLFEQMHPDSFTEQKKFLINSTRRLYPLQTEEPTALNTEDTKAKPKVKIPIKPKQ